MSVVLCITLLSILGILKGTAGYETKHLEIKNSENEVKCSLPNLNSLMEDYPKYSSITNDVGNLEDKIIEDLNCIMETRKKCECGKESEDKVCLEKFVSSVKNLVDNLNLLGSVYLNIAIDATSNISETASLALNELSCCCKVKVCIKKLEYPSAKYKEPIKECKPRKCNSNLSGLISKLPDFLGVIYTSRLLLDQCEEEYEKLLKAKDEIPKEGKCKEEIAACLFQRTQTVQLCFEKLTGQHVVLHENYNDRILFYATETMTELIRCSKESLKEKKD